MTGLRLPEGLDGRLNHLAAETKRSKSFYLREALEEYLEEHEEALLAIASYEDYMKSGRKGISLSEIKKKYNLDDAS
ncbi:MAG: ribbon-helix-helix protein, CopG family [Alphaproteobacteria bacterium]|nr:ribbon-helix-helix protein, CopG family [Alphaproteobacteria bacterium]